MVASDSIPTPLPPHDRRFWRYISRQAGCDVSWGLQEEFCRAMDVSPLELESPEEVLLDAPPAVDEEEAAREEAEFTRVVESSQAFRALEDGARAVMISCAWKGRHVSVMNDAAQRMVFTSEDVAFCLRTYVPTPTFRPGYYLYPDLKPTSDPLYRYRMIPALLLGR